MTSTLRRAMAGAGLTLLLAVGLTACGGTAPAPTSPPATAAATTIPAPTTGAATAAPGAKTPTSAASPVEMASPVGMASPVAAAMSAAATPVTAGASTDAAPASRRTLTRDCEGYVAWMNDPQVSADLEKTALWPEMVAAAEQAAAGETVDTARMAENALAMEKIAPRLRTTDETYDIREMGHLAAKAMGLAKHMADTLSQSDIDQSAVAADLAELKTAIADYEAEAAARARGCA